MTFYFLGDFDCTAYVVLECGDFDCTAYEVGWVVCATMTGGRPLGRLGGEDPQAPQASQAS